MMLLDQVLALIYLLFDVDLACAVKTHQICNGSSNAGVAHRVIPSQIHKYW